MTVRADTTTWRQELDEARQSAGDTSDVVAIAPSDDVLDVEFDAGFGLSAGPKVLVWTEERVYFPVVYDGSEWLGSAPRNPTEHGMGPVGGQ